jgi:hypothetical protein
MSGETGAQQYEARRSGGTRDKSKSPEHDFLRSFFVRRNARA